jgi:hypothetical protein
VIRKAIRKTLKNMDIPRAELDSMVPRKRAGETWLIYKSSFV